MGEVSRLGRDVVSQFVPGSGERFLVAAWQRLLRCTGVTAPCALLERRTI